MMEPLVAREEAWTNSSITEARKDRAKIPPDVVEATGKRFVNAAEQNPIVWGAVSAFLDYRSYLNVNAQPPLPRLVSTHDRGVITRVRFGNRGSSYPKWTAYGLVPSDQAATVGFIGEHLNLEHPKGAAFILFEGDEMILDGLEMRNVILRNVSIRHYGGPVVMQNVYFVNCTFTFPSPSQMPTEIRQLNIPTEPSIGKPKAPGLGNRELFANKILESTAVTLTAS